MNCAILLVLIFLYTVGYVDLEEWHSSIHSERSARYTLGGINPNGLGFITSSYIYTLFICKDKIKYYNYIIVFGILIFNIFVTNSRSCVLSESLFLILVVLYRRKVINPERANLFFKTFVIFTFCFNIALPFILSYFEEYNDLTSQRVEFLQYYLDNEGLYSFFFGGTEYDVDNSYMYILYKCGFLNYLLFFMILKATIDKLIVNKDFIGNSFIMSLLLSAYFENTLISPEFISTILLFSIIINSTKRTVQLNPPSQFLYATESQMTI